jgi:zinc D-Ala-D-Ala carboxypeptidase
LTGGVAYGTRARATRRRIRIRRIRAAGLLVALAATAAALGHEVLASPTSTASSATTAPAPVAASRAEPRGPLRGDDGAVPNGTTVFDDLPGVANLDPTLLDALRRAAARAALDGVEFVVDSGWRSAEYQRRLLQQAVLRYGSEEEAARWVATPTTSAHVSGDAVDLGRSAAAWLFEHGAEYGLCRIYRNESWHYELRPAAVDSGCPSMYADPTHDPRTQE